MFESPKYKFPKRLGFAAPEASLKNSGGIITNLDNQELTYGNSNFEQGGAISPLMILITIG